LRLLFINRCYWPDVEATGQLLTELCSDLAAEHQVTVIPGRPNFVTAGPRCLVQREEHAGVEIVRVGNRTFSKRSLAGRIIGLLSYLALAAWTAFRLPRADVIIVETDPPVLGVLGAALKWWQRRPLVYYLQDLYPEVGLVTGQLKPGLMTRLLRWATQLGLHHADRVVVLGDDMRDRVLQRGIDPARIAIVPNWTDTRLLRPSEPGNALRRSWGVDGRLVLMYSGNLGLSQGLDHVLQAARDLRDQPVEFVFVGDGARKADLMARAADWSLGNVRFLPYQPKERLAESLGAADLHLITLQRGLAGFIVPSKLYGILAAGRPYIAAVDADSDVAAVTARGQCGLRIDPNDPELLVQAIHWCLEHPQELQAMGDRGRQLAEQYFDRRIAVSRFARVLTELHGGRGAALRGLRSADFRGSKQLVGSASLG
jgi:colanic acid biosynthesis glycosyl transferase WcaI